MRPIRTIALSSLSIAIASLTTLAMAEEFANPEASTDFTLGSTAAGFVGQNNVVITDNAWNNPANILTTPNQVSISSENAGGFVTQAFGQKIGFHGTSTGRNKADIFWGSGFGFGDLGLQVGIGMDRTTSLATTTFESPDGGISYAVTSDTHSFDEGDDLVRATFNDNKTVESNNSFALTPGITMLNGQLELVTLLQWDREATSTRQDYKVVQDRRDGAGADTGSATNTFDIDNNDVVSTITANVNARFWLSDTVYSSGLVGLERFSDKDATKSTTSEVEADAAGTETSSDVNKDEQFEETSNTTYRLGAGIGLIESSARSEIRLEGGAVIVLESQSTVTEIVTDESTVNGTTTLGPTGTQASSEMSELSLRIPVRASFRAAVSEHWTWSAGVQTDLMTFTGSKEEEANITPDGENFEENYTALTAQGSVLNVTGGTRAAFGLSYEPIEDLTLDMVFNRDFLTGGGVATESIASRFTVSYRY